MPPMKIQPIDSQPIDSQTIVRTDSTKPPMLKSRLKRLFDRQFPNVLRISSSEKPNGGGEELEPSSVCLAKMVQNFMEDSNNDKVNGGKCGRNRCNCFHGNGNDSSDDEFDVFGNGGFVESIADYTSDTLKSLIVCASVVERNLLADTSKIVENNKNCKRKDDLRKIVTDELLGLGYDASICKSRWDKASSYPAGEYEYVDVIVEGERRLIDIDFRSEFEIARSTGAYKSILQSLPFIFVGKSDRLHQIISIVSEAAKQSLKKKGMHIAPWRKVEYMRNKWLSTHTRIYPQNDTVEEIKVEEAYVMVVDGLVDGESDSGGEFELIFGEKTTSTNAVVDCDETKVEEVLMWQPPAVKPKRKVVVTGLASLLREKP